MKKFLRTFAIAVAMLLPLMASAQTVTVADGTGTNSYVPVYGLYTDATQRTQSIYPQSMLSDLNGMQITALHYYVSSGSSNNWATGVFTVKMGITTQENLSSGFDNTTTLTTVYTGNLSASTTDGMSITLDTPFDYEGGNLIVQFQLDAAVGYTNCYFYGLSNQTGGSRYIQGSSYLTGAGTVQNFLPKVTFSVEELTGCKRVKDLAASNILNDGFTLTWIDTNNTGATYTVYDMTDSSVLASNLTTMSYTATGLNANTEYVYGVRSDCSDATNSSIATIAVRTACGITPVPYSTGIEGIADGALPYCWDTLATGHNSGGHVFPTAYPYASNAHSGSVYFEFESANGETEIAVLPEFDTPISSLQMNFWACATNTSNFVFEVGVVESGNFVVYDTVAITQSSSFSSSNYHYYQVFFNEYTGTGDRIALRVTPAGTATSYTFFMDDIEVTEFGGCFPIENLAVSNIGSSSVTLTWHDASNSGATYTVYDMADTSVVESAISDTTVTLTTLTPNTQYTLAVVADCSSLGESDAVTVSFRTNCAAEPLPFTETFDASLSSSDCWRGNSSTLANDVFGGSTLALNANNAWTYSSSTSNGLDAGHYRVNIYGTSCKKWMITPAIDLTTASNPVLQFDVAFTVYSSSSTGPATGFENNNSQAFIVAFSTDGGQTWDSSSAVRWQNAGGQHTLSEIASGSYINQTIDLSQFVGETIRIAFYCQSTTSGGDNNLHLDNIYVDEMPTCFPVAGLTVSAVTDNSVSLTWNDTTNTGATYTVYNMADTSVVAANVSATAYTVTGLTPNTNYTFGIEVNCSATDVARIMTVSTRTDCGVEMLPFTEDFSSSLSSDPCWRGASNATAAQVFNGTALNLVAPSSWSFTSSTRCGLDAGHYYKNVYGTNQKAWMITPAIDLSNVTSAQLSFDVALTDYSNAALPDDNGDTNTSQAFMVIISTDGGNTWDSTNATIWQNVGGDFTYASLASLTYQNKVIDLSQYAGDTIKIAFYTQAIWSGGDNDLHIDNIAVTEIADTTAPVLDSFVVVLGVNDTTMGTTVPAPGTYVFFDGDTATAQAIANDGYHFVRWEQVIGTFVDSTTANPASHVIDSTMLGLNMTMTAIFEADPVIVSDSVIVILAVNDATMGTTNPAAGTYVFYEGDTATATAVANDGYHFVRWDIALGTATDTMSVNPISVTIDTTMLGLTVNVTAIFEADSTPDTTVYYTLAVDYDTNMGMVMYMEGPYEAGDSAFVIAFANPGYRFVSYTEGATVVSTDAIYEFVMTGDLTLTANFEADTTASLDSLTIITGVNDPTMGTVTPAPGTHRYAQGDVYTITATPNDGYYFGGWIMSADLGFIQYTDTLYGVPAVYSDTVSEYELGAVVSIIALFTTDSVPVVNPDSIVVTFAVNDATMGTVNPAPGTYTYATTDSIFVEATAFDGYQFVGWHVEGSYMGYTVDSTIYTTETSFGESLEDMGGLVLTVTALFASDTVGPNPTMYTVTVSVNNSSLGSVSGAGTYAEGSTVTLTATPSENATFVGWLIDGDTITDNPYTFTITGHVTAMAIFAAGSNGIEDADMANVSVYGAESRIVVRGAEGKDVFVYDLNGRTVASKMNVAENTEFNMANTGVYLVKVGNAPAKRVLVVR